MPTYEYRCEKCGKKLEQFKKLEDCSIDVKCPFCKGDTHKIISASVPMIFIPFFDIQSDLAFTGHGQKKRALRAAGLEERGQWTKDVIEENKWKRKEKREKIKKRQRERKRTEIPAEGIRRAEEYFSKREGG